VGTGVAHGRRTRACGHVRFFLKPKNKNQKGKREKEKGKTKTKKGKGKREKGKKGNGPLVL